MISITGLADAIRKTEELSRELPSKAERLCERLASIGAVRVSMLYARSFYDGLKDYEIQVLKTKDGYRLSASGSDVMFIEFGAGITYGSGHPWAGGIGQVPPTGPGTYPGGKGHWDNPNGWWLPKDKGGGHTYGNPPSGGMYYAERDMRDSITQVIKEVFG